MRRRREGAERRNLSNVLRKPAVVEGSAGGEMHGGDDGGFLTFLTYFFDFFDLPAARYTRFRMPISVSPPSRAFALPVSPSVISRSIPSTTGSQSGVRRPVSK